MYKPSKKTIYLTGAFAAVAGLVGVYSYWNDISYAVCDKVYPEANEGEVRLKDSQGNRLFSFKPWRWKRNRLV